MTEQRKRSKEQQQLKDAFSAEIRAELKKPGSGKPSFEEFKAMVEDYEKNTPWYKKLWNSLEIWWVTRDVRK